MPIYAYRCESCGHAKDVLQKVSDEPLTICPACGAATFRKQLTAAGFQLKGSGWYVTDFRDGNKGAAKPGDKDGAAKDDGKAAGTKDGAEAGKAPEAAPAASPSPAPAAASTPAASPPAAPVSTPASGS